MLTNIPPTPHSSLSISAAPTCRLAATCVSPSIPPPIAVMINENAKTILSVRNLHASVEGTEILKDLNFEVKAGEIHAIMGLNGSGKSTFSKVLAGHPDYEVTAGEIFFQGQNLLELEPHERANAGVFLAFQYPLEIPGVSNRDFLRVAYNSHRKANGEEEIDVFDFDDLIEERSEIVKMDVSFLDRSVNVQT